MSSEIACAAWCQVGGHVYVVRWRLGEERRATRVCSGWARDSRLNLTTADAVAMAEAIHRVAREAEEK